MIASSGIRSWSIEQPFRTFMTGASCLSSLGDIAGAQASKPNRLLVDGSEQYPLEFINLGFSKIGMVPESA